MLFVPIKSCELTVTHKKRRQSSVWQTIKVFLCCLSSRKMSILFLWPASIHVVRSVPVVWEATCCVFTAVVLDEVLVISVDSMSRSPFLLYGIELVACLLVELMHHWSPHRASENICNSDLINPPDSHFLSPRTEISRSVGVFSFFLHVQPSVQ